MPAPDVPAVLSLAGHELRGPAGILGGYLKLLGRDRARLTDRQQQVVDAAERALGQLVATLDELREVQRRLLPDAPAPPTTTPTDLAAALEEAASPPPGGASVEVQRLTAAVVWVGDRQALVRALAACLEAVAREHLPPVTLQVRPSVAEGVALVQVVARGAPGAAYAAHPLDVRRSGVGLRLVLAQLIVEAGGGALHDLTLDGAPAGIALTLPVRVPG
jgi:K+-sensing histidine kinase KdpD